MLSSRNIHFAVLGIILGATSGYVFAFYQIDQKIPAAAPAPPASAVSDPSGGAQPGHPNVSNDQILAMFKTQLQKDPNNVEILERYGDFLSDINQFDDAIATYRQILTLQPTNLTAQTYLGTALWNVGKKDEAVAAYEKSLKADPNHVPTLYYMALVDLDKNHDINAAAAKAARIEKIDATLPALVELKKRIEEEKKKGK